MSLSQSVLSPDQPCIITMVGKGAEPLAGRLRSVSKPIPSKLGISPVHFWYVTPSGVVILDVLFEVIGETVDALREERDLHFGRPRVALVDAELLDQALLLFDGERHRNFLQSPRSGKPSSTRTGSKKLFCCEQIRRISRGSSEVK